MFLNFLFRSTEIVHSSVLMIDAQQAIHYRHLSIHIGRSPSLNLRFMFPLPLLGITHAKAMIEYLTDLLKCHSLGLSVTEGDKQETGEANAGIESKGTAR